MESLWQQVKKNADKEQNDKERHVKGDGS